MEQIHLHNTETLNPVLYPLTHPQKRIWYIEKLYPNTSVYNIGGVSRVTGRVDFVLLEEAINLFIRTNNGVRLRFSEQNGVVGQYVHDYQREKFDCFDFSAARDPETEFQHWVKLAIKKPFSLIQNRLYYFALLKIDDRQAGIFVRFHHIIADGWSINIVSEQIYTAYKQLARGEEPTAQTQCSYIEFIQSEQNYLNSERFHKNRAFWMEKFTELPELLFEADSDSTAGERVLYLIENTLSQRIKEFVIQRKSSLNTFFVVLFLIYLSKITQKNDPVIGTPVLNRSGKKEKSIFGMFTSTMPFIAHIDPQSGALELFDTVNEDLLKFYFHQKYPYDLLVQDLELKKKGYDSLFQVSVNYYNTRIDTEVNGFPVKTEEYYNGHQFYLLQLIIKDWEEQGNLSLEIDYKTVDFTVNEIQRMFGHLIHMAGQILANPGIIIKQLQVLTQAEMVAQIEEYNANGYPYPKNQTIYRLFEEQAARNPDRIAICFENAQLSFRELNQKANQLARVLQTKGVTRNTITGLLVTHSLEAVIAILGVIKAGGAYLPIDPEYPADRIEYMLHDSGCRILLTHLDSSLVVNFQGEALSLTNLELYAGDGSNLPLLNQPDDLVYVIYTSGSTGKPKGVMIKHQSLVNYIWWAKKVYVRDEDDSFALYSSLSFDLSVTSIFTPLIGGNRIVVYRDDGPEYVLFRIMKEKKTSIVKLTPSHLSLLQDLDNRTSAVKRFIVGGEDFKTGLAARIHESFGGNIEMYNEYGPTETVVGCMIHKFNIDSDLDTSVPIGVPADNVRIYILDRELNPLPLGSIGEMYIAGDGVAAGYLNRPELSAERFIPDPFCYSESNLTMYKTGDLARFLENGKMEYAGRSDHQIKIRGYRVELGEIEKQLVNHTLITKAVVIDGRNQNGDKYLCAYFTMNAGTVLEEEREIQSIIAQIKDYLRQSLPEYMVPAYLVPIAEIPLTSNGKVNRSLLPEPGMIGGDPSEYIAPANEIERKLLEIIGETLGIKDIGMNGNFYHYGGDSIKAIQVAAKLSDTGLKIKVRDILSRPVIAEMASCLEYDTHRIDQAPCTGSFRPTPIYGWFFSRHFQDENHYNQSLVLELTPEFPLNDLERIMAELVKHHDSLRLNYNRASGELFYNPEHLDPTRLVQSYDLSAFFLVDQEQKMRQWGIELKSGFQIEDGILFKAAVFDLGSQGKRLLLTAHHLVIDGVSWRIIIEDLERLCSQIKNGRRVALPLKTHSLKDWVVQLESYATTLAASEKSFWEQACTPTVNFPVDFDLGEDLPVNCDTVVWRLTPEETARLMNSAEHRSEIQATEMIICALVLTIRNLTHNNEVVIELEGHGREEIMDDINVTRTVGWFTSIYPAVFQLTGGAMADHLLAVKEQLQQIPNHGIGFGILRHYQGLQSGVGPSQFIRFNYLGDFSSFAENDYFKCIYEDPMSDSSPCNHLTALMDIQALILEKQFTVSLTFSTHQFKAATIHDFAGKFQAYLREALEYNLTQPAAEVKPSDFEMVKLSQDDLDSFFE